jgi:uncharacterized protein YhbP (UPF0306 family)
MSDETLKKEILDYVEGHGLARIAVTDGQTPSAHTVYYVSRGLHIYFSSDPHSQKIHILSANPNISLTIDEDYEDWEGIRGVQVFGRARQASRDLMAGLRADFLRKFPSIGRFGGIPDHHIFMDVTPEKIYFLDFTKKFGHKTIYYHEEDKGRISW